MPKFKSPYKVADNLIKIYEEEVMFPYTMDVDTLVKLTGRKRSFRALERRLFQKVSEILKGKGYLMFEVPTDENDMVAIAKTEYILKNWRFLDERDVDNIAGIVEDEEDLEILIED